MTNLLTNPAQIVNAALDGIGYKKRIGSLYDGSEASVKALDIYGQTRDAMLRSFDWGFAARDIALTLLKTAPVGGYSSMVPWTNAYPILPWIYEYAYPADMVKLRSVRPASVIPEYDPVAIEFGIANDNAFVPPQRVILTNLPNAIAVYTGQVTDPLTWDPSFTQAFVDELGKKLAPALDALEALKVVAQEGMMETGTAERKLG